MVANRLRCFLTVHLFRGCPLFRLLFSPGVSFLAGAKAGKIAPAGRAAIRRSAQAQQHRDPLLGTVVLLAPGGQFLTITARATRVFPGSAGPDAGKPTRAASPASQGIDTHQTFEIFYEILPLGNAYIARSTVGTSQLHREPSNRV